jgi:WD40 repeat protein
MSDAFHIQAADVHPNNRSLFTVSGDGVVQLQHILDDKSDVWIYELSEKKRRLESEVAYNTDGSRIACCWKGADAILVWETGDRSEPVNRIPIDPGTTFKTLSLDCDRDQMAALLTSWNEPAVVRYWDIVTGEEISTLQITTDYIYRAAFARKTTVLLTKHDWEKIHVWKLEGDRATLSRTIDGWFSAFDVTGSGDVIAVGCRDYAIRFYDAHTGAKLAVHRGHTNYVTSLRFSPQGDRLVSSSEHDQTTRVWDTTKKALSANSPSATDDCSFTRIKFSSSGKYIAAIAQGDPRVFLWDGETGNFLTTLLGHAESVATLSFSADDSILASVSEDGVVVLWDMQQEVMLPWTLLQSKSTISLKSIDMTFNANSKLLAIVFKVDESFVVRLYDVSNRNWAEGGEELSQSEPNDGNLPHLIHFSPGEPLVLLRHAVPGEEVRIWDQATKTVERRVHDEIQSTWVLPFDIEDLLWITSSKSRRRLFWLPRYRAPVNSDGMDAHGDRLAIASRYGTLTLLDMSRLKDARK